jgi:hypothetical protein
MSQNLEEIRALIFKEVLGELTPAERDFLYAEVEGNERYRAMRADILRVLEVKEVKDYVKAMPAVDPADVVIGKIHARRSRKRAVMMACSAAAASVLLFVWVNKRPPASIEREAMLTLPGGKVVTLGKDLRKRFGDVQLVNKGDQLTYTGGKEEFATLTTPVGKGQLVVLPDGTRVQLNAGTSVRFRLGFGQRELYINGEAYVEVAKDASRPFVVHVPRADVRVLGTAFNVNSYDEEQARVALVEGKVQVIGGTDSVLLQPGQQSIVSRDGQVKMDFDREEILSWREGRYVLNNTPLSDVCVDVSRWYGQEIVLDDVALGSKRFSGEIERKEPLEVFLKAMKATNGIDYYLDDKGKYHIRE